MAKQQPLIKTLYRNQTTSLHFPSNIQRHISQEVHMKMAGAVILYDTPKCRYNILKWALLCALTPDCIFPPGSRKTCPPHNAYSYDQSRYNDTTDRTEYEAERLLPGARKSQRFQIARYVLNWETCFGKSWRVWIVKSSCNFWKFGARFTCHRFDQAMTSILVENFNGYHKVCEMKLWRFPRTHICWFTFCCLSQIFTF